MAKHRPTTRRPTPRFTVPTTDADTSNAPFPDHQNGTAQRDAKGQFAKGHKGGPGRPRRAVELEYIRALSNAVSPEAWEEVCAVALQQALKGDDKARQFLAKYLLGDKPPSLLTVAAGELGGSALGEIELLQEMAGQAAVWFYKRFCDSGMDRFFDAAERALDEARGEVIE